MAKAVGLSYSNANNLARQMADAGLVGEMTGQRRNRIYSYGSYLKLFQDEEDGQPSE